MLADSDPMTRRCGAQCVDEGVCKPCEEEERTLAEASGAETCTEAFEE